MAPPCLSSSQWRGRPPKRYKTPLAISFDDVYGKAKNMSSLDVELDAGEENLGDDILSLSTADIQARARLMDNEVLLGF